MKHAVLLAGGLGTRLSAVSGGLPKPMVEVAGRPFIEHVLDLLVAAHCEHMVIAASHKWQLLRERMGTRYRSSTLDWSIESEPLGTGGAMRQAFSNFDLDSAFVLNADTLFRIDLVALERQHQQTDASVTLALREVADISRYGEVVTDRSGRITQFSEKGASGPGLINGGTYLVNSRVWSDPWPRGAFSFERDFLERRVATDAFYGFRADGYFIDIGIPQDLERARRDLSQP